MALCDWVPALSGAAMARLFIVVIACKVSLPLVVDTYQAYPTAPWTGLTEQNSVWPSVTTWLASALTFEEPPDSAKLLPSAPTTVFDVATPLKIVEFW